MAAYNNENSPYLCALGMHRATNFLNVLNNISPDSLAVPGIPGALSTFTIRAIARLAIFNLRMAENECVPELSDLILDDLRSKEPAKIIEASKELSGLIDEIISKEARERGAKI